MSKNKGFYLYERNKIESLSMLLCAKFVQHPLKDPFEKEVIIIQSQGMSKWISSEIAKYQGVCANIEFAFPNSFINDIYQDIFSDVNSIFFDRRAVSFRLMKILPDFLEYKEFKVIKDYIGTGKYSQFKLYQLCSRIAYIFDNYQVYRPNMIIKWSKNEKYYRNEPDEIWQMLLWKELNKSDEGKNRSKLYRDFLNKIKKGEFDIKLPSRINVFGVSILPSYHIKFFEALSIHTEVNFFLMNPCREFWLDIKSEREKARALLRYIDKEGYENIDEEKLHFFTGNALLAELGILGRDFFAQILDVDSNIIEGDELIENNNNTLLNNIQNDINSLTDTSAHNRKKIRINEHDKSVQINICHGKYREIEILKDYILTCFDEMPHLKPWDILVMAPDIKEYAPYINAIFERKHKEDVYIKYSISDLSVYDESKVIELFFEILELYKNRFEVSQVFSIIQNEVIKNIYNFDDQKIEYIRKWILDMNVHWGIDANSRKELGFGDYFEYSWEYAIERILLGYAISQKDEIYAESILPYTDIEGESAILAGDLTDLFYKLKNTILSLQETRTLHEWALFFEKFFEDFMPEDTKYYSDVMFLKEFLKDFVFKEDSVANISEYNEKVSFEVIHEFLKENLKKDNFGRGFLDGGITFSSMLPMRSIPSKIICVIGMDNDSFPKKTTSMKFDLIEKYPSIGDRSSRNSDKYLFLETLLSARDRFYMSYRGQSIKDNSQLVPSVILSLFQEYIEDNYEIVSQYIFSHKLQGFNSEYFTKDSNLKSFSKENFKAFQKINNAHTRSLNIDEKNQQDLKNKTNNSVIEVSIEEFSSFFQDPIKYYLTNIVGIDLYHSSYEWEDNEPMELDGLKNYIIEKEILELLIKGYKKEKIYSILKLSSKLPPENFGKYHFEKCFEDANYIIDNMNFVINKRKMEKQEIFIEENGVKITGTLNNIFENDHLMVSPSKIKPKNMISLWINHILLNNSSSKDISSFYFGKDNKKIMFKKIENNSEILKKMIILFKSGNKEPLKFIPDSSFEYVKEILKGSDSKEGLKKALNKYSRSLEYNEHYNMVFDIDSLFDNSFCDISDTIFRDLINNVVEDNMNE